MVRLAPRHSYTFSDYLDLEYASQVRHEVYEGEVYAMAGGTPEHSALAAGITMLLGGQLRGGNCRVYSSELRLRVLATGLATYPDVTVICGASERDPNSPTHVTNPKLLVEVLSPGTEQYDRGEKLTHYRQVPSCEAVLLVDHRERSLELWPRRGEQWSSRKYGVGEEVEMAADCGLLLRLPIAFS